MTVQQSLVCRPGKERIPRNGLERRQFLALRFPVATGKAWRSKILTGALQRDSAGCRLKFRPGVKMEIPF
jgi:hypothetical protein